MGAPAAPNPMNTVWGPPWASRRVSPPKYDEEVALGAEDVLEMELRDFSTSLVRASCEIPVPRTAMLSLVKAEEAKDLMSFAVMEL